MGKWLATSPVGGLVKMFVALLLGSLVVYLGDPNHDALTLHTVWTWVGAALIVVLPIVINALNPSDPRYGSKG